MDCPTNFFWEIIIYYWDLVGSFGLAGIGIWDLDLTVNLKIFFKIIYSLCYENIRV